MASRAQVKEQRAAAKPRMRYIKRRARLRADRTSWDAHYWDLSEQIQPRRARFFSRDTNRGGERNQNIINNTPVRSMATLSAGIQEGQTSPSRPWYRYVAPTPALSQVASVKSWLHVVEESMREVFARSNFYNSIHSIYGDLGTFATGVMYMEEDVEDIIRCEVLMVGQYCLALDARGRVSTVYRDVTLSVEQLVEKFGYDSCSQRVKDLFDQERVDEQVDIIHVVEPNDEYSRGKIGRKGKKWKSCWMELIGDDRTGFLLESGYNEFPYMCPRWDVAAGDTYGSGSPGMEVLGDCKALQHFERQSATAFNKTVDPAMVGPSSLNGQEVSLLPGDVTYVDSMSAGMTFKPAHEIMPQALQAFEVKIANTEKRIKAGCYADLWLALLHSEGSMTAREVEERHEEKMLQLGPVVGRMQDELLAPAIERAFMICLRRNMFPPAPKELQGTQLSIQFTSIMAVAQKLVDTAGIERLVGFVMQQAAIPALSNNLDVIDFDQANKAYGDALNVAPAIIRSAEAIAKIRAAVQRAQAAQQQQAMAQQQAEGAQALSNTKLGQGSALDALLPQMGFGSGAAA